MEIETGKLKFDKKLNSGNCSASSLIFILSMFAETCACFSPRSFTSLSKPRELIPSPYTKFAEDWTNKRSCKFSNKNSPLLNHQVFPDFLSKNATLVLTAEKIVKFLNISNSNVFSIKFSISIILV